MIYLLMFFVSMLLGYAYILTNKDILSPWLISCAMYLLSIVVAAINASEWNFQLKAETMLTIVGALIAFGVGELTIRYTYGKQSLEKKIVKIPSKINNGKPIYIPTYQVVLITIIMLAILYWDFNETYRVSLLGGNPGTYTLMLKYFRSASTEFSVNSILTMLLALCNSMAYFLIFVIMYNIIFFGNHVKWRIYMMPIIIFICQLILTSGREFFIQLISTFMILCYCLVKIKNNWQVKNRKLIYSGILAIIVFLAAFFVLGFLTNKSILGFKQTISLYIGGSIMGLDYYLQNPVSDYTYFGGHTLFGIYSSLRQIGFDIPRFYAPFEFFYIGKNGVNIYTPLRRYIEDFSYLGMIFIQFLLGVIYSSALVYLRRQKKVGVFIIIFAMFFYPIVESAIEERFFMLVLSFNAAYKAFGVVLFYWLFLGRRSNKVVSEGK